MDALAVVGSFDEDRVRPPTLRLRRRPCRAGARGGVFGK